MLQAIKEVSNGRSSITQRYQAVLIQSKSEIEEWLKLRYDIFAEELGAQLETTHQGVDTDFFDGFCDHLVVKDLKTQQIVGGTRILNDSKLPECGGFYSEHEFDMRGFLPLVGKTIEIGRTCIHADYRRGSVISVLWSGLAAYMLEHKVRNMIGCASISMADGGYEALEIMRRIRRDHPAPERLKPIPKQPMPTLDSVAPLNVKLPPLLKAYIRLGVYVAPEAYWDQDFNMADAFIWLDTRRLSSRYQKHFMGDVSLAPTQTQET